MVALANLPNPFATVTSYKAFKTPKKTIQYSIRVPLSSLRRTRRKNYLRPKILKTLTKPYNIPLQDPIVDPIQPTEPNVEVPLEPVTEKLDYSFAEESETTFGLNESDLGQLEVDRRSEAGKLVRFGGLSGRTVVRIVGSFVGLFILQSVVAAWVMGSGNSDEKNGNLVIDAWVTGSGNSDEKNGNLVIEDQKKKPRLRRREGEVGFNGNTFLGNWAGVNVDVLEMEAKISEIRKMAQEVREAEKKKKLEDGEADLDDLGEDEEDDDDSEDVESALSRDNNGIVKEVDGRLSKLRKRHTAPSVNVDVLNKLGGTGKEGKDGGLDAEEEKDNMLLYKMKHKFRSHLTTPKDKPKGFQSIDDLKEKHSNMDVEKPVEQNGGGNDLNQKLNVLDSVFPGKRDDKEEKIPVSQSSKPSQGFKKRSGSTNAGKQLDKGINDPTASANNETARTLNTGMNEVAKTERGLVQESSNGNNLDKGVGVKKSSTVATPDKKKIDGHVTSTSSEMLAKPPRKGQPHINKRGSKLPQISYKDEEEIADPWWSKLPYVLVVLMQKGSGNEADRGFYNIKIESDADSKANTSYTVAFEDRNDAQNFSYLLESALEDLPDAAVDIAPLSKKDFKEVAETLENKVIVVRKGELRLYAGQPLADAEAALRSLLK